MKRKKMENFFDKGNDISSKFESINIAASEKRAKIAVNIAGVLILAQLPENWDVLRKNRNSCALFEFVRHLVPERQEWGFNFVRFLLVNQFSISLTNRKETKLIACAFSERWLQRRKWSRDIIFCKKRSCFGVKPFHKRQSTLSSAQYL